MRNPREVLSEIRGTLSPARRRPVNVLIENELAEAVCGMAEIVESVLDRLDKLEAQPPARHGASPSFPGAAGENGTVPFRPKSKKPRNPEQEVTR